MNALLALAAFDVAAGGMIAGIFAYLALQTGQKHLRRWAIAWGLLAVAQIFTANEILGRPVSQLEIGAPVAAGAAILFLVAGTDAFVGRAFSHRWTLAVLLSAVGVGLLEHLGVDPFRASTPTIAVLVVAILACAVALFRRRPGRGSHRFSAVALALWALNSASYPLVGDLEAARPLGSGISAFLQIAVGIGLLLAHSDNVREALSDLAHQLGALIEFAAVGVFRTDADGKFRVANQKLTEILGHPDFGALQDGCRLTDLGIALKPEEGSTTDSGLALFDQETVWKRPDGRRRHLHIIGRRISGGEGALQAIDGFVTDITEQSRRNLELESARRLQAVGRLTGGIAHDFNNLLTVIIANLELARSSGRPETIDDALEASWRASQLTRQLLTFARSQDGNAATVDLVLQVDVLVRLLTRTMPESIELSVDHEEATCVAALPPGDLDQIVLNLVVNARDALEGGGGRIQVTTRKDEHQGAPFAVVSVSDDGPGIDPEVIDSIFEPFVSTQDTQEGLGLGLSIVHGLVERAGGRVDLTGAPGEGSRFEVWLPAAKHTEVSTSRGSGTLEGTGTILLIDDDPMVLRSIAKGLEQAGFEVVVAAGVAEATAALHPGLAAVVSDVALQDGDGFEVLDAVLEMEATVPCILMSGYPDQVIRQHPHRDVPFPILAKPFRMTELMEILEQSIGQPPPLDRASPEQGGLIVLHGGRTAFQDPATHGAGSRGAARQSKRRAFLARP